jgi:hypothetical protein
MFFLIACFVNSSLEVTFQIALVYIIVHHLLFTMSNFWEHYEVWFQIYMKVGDVMDWYGPKLKLLKNF